MHSTPTHATYTRVSRRGLHDAAASRLTASVAPCLHPTQQREAADRD